MSEATGVVVPLDGEKRSTSALGRGVVGDALRGVDPDGAAAAGAERDWRRGYGRHFRRLVEAGLDAPDDARRVAADGLASVGRRMRWVDPAGATSDLRSALADGADDDPFSTATVLGEGTAETTLSVPYRGRRLVGDELRARLADWVARGVVEPSCAEAVALVQEHPEWLALRDRTVVVLGAAAEMGPLRSLLRWGADVVALDLPRPQLWRGVLEDARRYAGTLRVPVRGGESGGDVADRAGADLLHDLPRVARWLEGIEEPFVLGNYVYADGAVNLRLSAGVDALTDRVLARRPDVALAFLATPTDVFAVPREAVEASQAAYSRRARRRLASGLRTLSRDRLLRSAYPGLPPTGEAGINDSVVAQQGPNYLLAKRIHRWRATDARAAGREVAFSVAPPTRTRSVVKNRLLAAAYTGAPRFGVEVFEPATSNTLMAALLVHDLCAGAPARAHPWQDEAAHAAHGGLWRIAYDPRSALGIAAVLGLGARH